MTRIATGARLALAAVFCAIATDVPVRADTMSGAGGAVVAAPGPAVGSIVGPPAGIVGSPAPMYFPADPGIAFGAPGVAYPGGYPGQPGPMVPDNYATPMAGPFGQGLFSQSSSCPPSRRAFRIVGGVDLLFAQPFFENNDALTIVESDGVTFQSINTVQFDYGAEFSPRVWLKGEWQNGGGLRVAYWQFNHSASQVVADAPGNGFGRVSPPNRFGNVDISAVVPGEQLIANSSLEMFAVDVEGVKEARLENWRLVLSGGLRFAEIDQHYLARMTNNGVLSGEIDFRHKQEGFGPTAAILAERPLPLAFTLFTESRIALLYGDASSNLSAGEDLDLINPFRTTAVVSRDDLLFVAETRLGVLWGPRFFDQWYPFIGLALEGQFWDGAGSASTEEGNLGLFGLNVMLGASW